jgi:hypothetical protein
MLKVHPEAAQRSMGRSSWPLNRIKARVSKRVQVEIPIYIARSKSSESSDLYGPKHSSADQVFNCAAGAAQERGDLDNGV